MPNSATRNVVYVPIPLYLKFNIKEGEINTDNKSNKKNIYNFKRYFSKKPKQEKPLENVNEPIKEN